MNDVNMLKRVWLISNKPTGFWSTSIKSHLEREEYDVVYSSFNIDVVNGIEDKPNLILLIYENIEEEDNQFLFYIRDLCIENNKWVYLCGYANEVKHVTSILPTNIVRGTFIRPFTISEWVSRMNKEIDKLTMDGAKKHILVVDDSGEMLHAIRSWLSDTYRVSIVNSVANAILFLANQKPDLLLLDYEMPFCTGPQMMEMIRAENETSSIPIMFLTGKSDEESVRKVLSMKPEGYMLKTMKPEEIKEIIDKFFIAKKAKEFNNEI